MRVFAFNLFEVIDGTGTTLVKFLFSIYSYFVYNYYFYLFVYYTAEEFNRFVIS